MQEIDVALHLALERAGNNMAAKMAMMAITTSNSIKVKPELSGGCRSPFGPCVFAFMKLFLILIPLQQIIVSYQYVFFRQCQGVKPNSIRAGRAAESYFLLVRE